MQLNNFVNIQVGTILFYIPVSVVYIYLCANLIDENIKTKWLKVFILLAFPITLPFTYAFIGSMVIFIFIFTIYRENSFKTLNTSALILFMYLSTGSVFIIMTALLVKYLISENDSASRKWYNNVNLIVLATATILIAISDMSWQYIVLNVFFPLLLFFASYGKKFVQIILIRINRFNYFYILNIALWVAIIISSKPWVFISGGPFMMYNSSIWQLILLITFILNIKYLKKWNTLIFVSSIAALVGKFAFLPFSDVALITHRFNVVAMIGENYYYFGSFFIIFYIIDSNVSETKKKKLGGIKNELHF